MDPANLSLPELGISLSANARLRVDWKQVTEGISQTISDLIFKTWADGGASAVVSATKVLNSGKIDLTSGDRAFNMIVSSFGWAVGLVVTQYSIEHEYVLQSIMHSIRRCKLDLTGNNYIMGPDFLKNPTSSDFYQAVKNYTIDQLMLIIEPLGFQRNVLASKIDIAFIRGLYEVWSDSPTSYAELASIIQSPFTDISESVLGWQAYRNTIISEFEVKPIFGQEIDGISLSQLYVPLRGYWPIKSTGESHEANYQPGGVNTHVVMIDEEIDSWLLSDGDEDWLRLIGGGPGSGKSTTLKNLACRYAKQDSWRPLYIPLQHIGVDGDLRQKINAYFADRTGSAFKQPPISRQSVESGPPLLLIFDCLDELSAPNEAANDTVQNFTGKLNSLYSSLTGNNRAKVRVIVSGRLPAFQAAKRFLPIGNNGAIEAYGYAPTRRHTVEETLWTLDQRPTWWKQYAAAKSIGQDSVPEALISRSLQGISHEPLLCYLLALSNYTGENWHEAASNPNLIYKALINSVYERGWGDGPQKRLGPGRSMTAIEFNTLMQTFGLAAWLGGDARIAAEPMFKATLNITRGVDAWEAFERDNGSDMNNLAMNFYLKSSDISHRGFEFTHKSFGEYLAAKALVEFSFSIYDLADRSIDGALQEWFKATKTGVMSAEVYRFIINEIRLKDNISLNKLKDIKKSFERLASILVGEGYSSSPHPVHRVAEYHHNNAEISIWCILSAIITKMNKMVDTPELINIKWSAPYDLVRLIERRASQYVFSLSPADCLAYINAEGQRLIGLSTFGIDLRGANLSGINIESCYFAEADLTGANLTGSVFYSCHFANTTFASAIFSNVRFTDCVFNGCSFIETVIDGLLSDTDTLLKSDDLTGMDYTKLTTYLPRTNKNQQMTWHEIREDINKKIDKLQDIKIM